MKQIIQHLNNGKTELIEVPAPMVRDGYLLIQSSFSLVSIGTERMLLDFAKANWFEKARQQPERVKELIDKIKTDGLLPTIEAVKSKINQPIPLGYANVGKVVAVGKGVQGFKVGDRVASNGAHAELVHVPQNLVALVPENVSDENAVFTVLAAIALQGIRLLQPTFGETVVVYGLGLVGQIAVQLLMANGCRVIGIDKDAQKCAWAQQQGVQAFCNAHDQNIAQTIFQHEAGQGVDAVIITASAQRDSILSDAAKMCRKRARIVLVGVVDLHLNRSDFYEKELSFQVSASYGPGRYDYQYEKNGLDYPLSFVRWTAQRNFEAVLQAMSLGQLKLEQLIHQKIPLESFEKVYQPNELNQGLVTLFEYPAPTNLSTTIVNPKFSTKSINTSNANANFAVIGAGAFASKVLIPSVQKAGAKIDFLCSQNGLNAAMVAKQNQIAQFGTDVESVFSNGQIGAIMIATPHDSHAQYCIKGLQASKHVFVEKPLALSLVELDAIREQYLKSSVSLSVGFNRRFAPFAIRMKELIGEGPDLNMILTVNAGTISSQHWLSDNAKSGGRVVGELCHFIDLAAFFAGAHVSAICGNSLGQNQDDVSLLLQFENGCTASIQYFTNGNKAYDKERIELYRGGKTLVLENWKKLSGYGFKNFKSSTSIQDKGHARQFKLWYDSVMKGLPAIIDFDSLYNSTAASILAVESIQDQQWKKL